MPDAALIRNWSDRTYESGNPPVTQDMTTFDRPESETWPPEREILLAAIAYLSNLQDGWNGYSARKPTELSVLLARKFIGGMFLNCFFPDKVAPDGEGGVSFSWKRKNENIIVTVDSNLLHLSHTYGGAPEKDLFLDNIPFDGQIIPLEIKKEIPKRLRR